MLIRNEKNYEQVIEISLEETFKMITSLVAAARAVSTVGGISGASFPAIEKGESIDQSKLLVFIVSKNY